MAAKLTIAIPTHNRASTLRQTLDAVCALKLAPQLDAECVVVDNNSTDDTASVVEDFARREAISIRRVMESRVGSSFARNRAVDASRGEFIFFLDDDVIPEPDWAVEMAAEIERRVLDVACGEVIPRWVKPRPDWLGPSVYVKLAVHAPEALETSARNGMETLHNYFSANVGFRRTAFERFGRFREDLGVVGGKPFSGEDTELFARIIARGGSIGFASRARVHHLIGPERMTRSYLRHKSFAYGMGSAYAGGRSHNQLDKLIRNVYRMVAAAARRDQEGALYHQLECVNFFGYWRGRLTRRRPAPHQPPAR